MIQLFKCETWSLVKLNKTSKFLSSMYLRRYSAVKPGAKLTAMLTPKKTYEALSFESTDVILSLISMLIPCAYNLRTLTRRCYPTILSIVQAISGNLNESIGIYHT